MTLESLAELVEKTESSGGSYIILSVPMRREPRNYDRCRVVPGLYGRCVGWSGEKNIYVVDIKTADVRKYLAKRV